MSWFPSCLINPSRFKLLVYGIPLRGLSNHCYDEFHFSNISGEQENLGLEIIPVLKCAIHLIKDKDLSDAFSSRHYPLSIIFTIFRNEVYDSQNTKLFSSLLFWDNYNTEKIKKQLILWMFHFISKEEVYHPFKWPMMILCKSSSQSLLTSLNPALNFVH